MDLKRVTFIGTTEETIAAAAQLLAITVKDGARSTTWDTQFGRVRIRSTSRAGWTVHVAPSPVQPLNVRRPPRPYAQRRRVKLAPQALPGDHDAED